MCFCCPNEPLPFSLAGNRDVLVSPGSYFFLSNSCGQGEEWLKSLNRGVWIPFTGNCTNSDMHMCLEKPARGFPNAIIPDKKNTIRVFGLNIYTV